MILPLRRRMNAVSVSLTLVHSFKRGSALKLWEF
jgi:hypothetical protein